MNQATLTPQPTLETSSRVTTAGYMHPRSPEQLEPLIQAAKVAVRTARDNLEDLQAERNKAEEFAEGLAKTGRPDFKLLDEYETRFQSVARALRAGQKTLEEATTALADLEHESKAFARDEAVWAHATDFMAIVRSYDAQRDLLLSTVMGARVKLEELREAAISKHMQAVGMGVPSSDRTILRALLTDQGISGRALELLLIDASGFRAFEESQPILRVNDNLDRLFATGKLQ
jgi:hypothetical protein